MVEDRQRRRLVVPDSVEPIKTADVRGFMNSNLDEIEHAVSGLSPADLSRFREWFFEFDAEVWDRQFEKDVAAGRLDALADEALADLSAGRTKPL